MKIELTNILFVILMVQKASPYYIPEDYYEQVCSTETIYYKKETTILTTQDYQDYHYYNQYGHTTTTPAPPKISHFITTCQYLELPLKNLNQEFGQELYNRHLIITESNITTIPPSAFIECCNSIKILQMDDVNIINVEPGAFNGLQKLSNLSLKNNEIETVTRGIFNSLNSLENLDLSYNRIQLIEAKSFLGLNNLTELLLNNNDITNLESNLFEDLKRLQYLDLSVNQLKEIDLRFSNLKKLNIAENQLEKFEIDLTHLPIVSVNLSNNEISSIDFSLFPRLNQLDLSNNNLMDLKNWSYLSCSDINLNYNQLKNIGEIDENTQIFRANNNNLTNLESMISRFNTDRTRNLIEFDVSFNKIKKLDQNIFTGFTNLQQLYLQHNQIDEIESGCFRYLNKLIILDLSSNQLNYLPYGIFDQLTNLQTLNLSYNYLTNFNYYSMNSLIFLNQLYLDHNLIKSFNGDDLSFYLVNLKQISLDGNKFYCKDLAKLFHILNRSDIQVLPGTVFNQENVKGIPCYTDLKINYDNNATIDGNFYNSSFYRFFQIDFQKSNFVKFFKDYINNNNNVNETIDKIGNFDYLHETRIENNGNNYKRDPVIVGLFIFFAIIVFLLTINLYTMKQNKSKNKILNC